MYNYDKQLGQNSVFTCGKLDFHEDHTFSLLVASEFLQRHLVYNPAQYFLLFTIKQIKSHFSPFNV